MAQGTIKDYDIRRRVGSLLQDDRTEVLIPDGSPAARDAGASATAALGLPITRMRSDTAAEVDATVLLGTEATR